MSMHGCLFFICLYRELFSSIISTTGNFLKAIEVLFMFLNLAVIIQTIDCLLAIIKPNPKEIQPPCISNPHVYE